MLTGPRRFNRRIQCQDIGLERNTVNHAGDVRNAARRQCDTVHGAHHTIHSVTAALGNAAGIRGQGVGLYSRISTVPHGGQEFLHARSDLFKVGGRLLGTRRQIAVACSYLAAGARYRRTGLAHAHHQLRQARLHARQARQQGTQFVPAARLRLGHSRGEVTFGNAIGHFGGMGQRPQNGTRQQPSTGQTEQQAHQRARRQQRVPWRSLRAAASRASATRWRWNSASLFTAAA